MDCVRIREILASKDTLVLASSFSCLINYPLIQAVVIRGLHCAISALADKNINTLYSSHNVPSIFTESSPVIKDYYFGGPILHVFSFDFVGFMMLH